MTLTAAVTGWAWRTPLGSNIDAVMTRLWAGEHGVGPLSDEVGEHTYACHLCARIAAQPARTPHHRFVRRAGLLGMEAAHEAARMADVAARAQAGERVGVYVGYGGLRAHWSEMMPALAEQVAEQTELWRRGLRHLHPFWMLRYLSNNAHALFAADIQGRDDGVTCGGGTSGAGALAAAARALRLGVVDVAVVFAYDSLIHPDVLVDLAARGRLSAAQTPTAWRGPYDQSAAGGIPAEGAAALVLERADAQATPARPILAWVAAQELADGAPHEPSPTLIAACARGLLPPDGSPRGWLLDGAARADLTHDAAERDALASTFAHDTPLTATAAAFGMLGAAQPLAQVIALASCLRARRLPPIPHLVAQAPGPLRPVMGAEAALDAGVHTALGLSTASPGLVGAVRVALSPVPSA
jgi:3-oxoacyl-(acyl-carrier-protein) synthase